MTSAVINVQSFKGRWRRSMTVWMGGGAGDGEAIFLRHFRPVIHHPKLATSQHPRPRSRKGVNQSMHAPTPRPNPPTFDWSEIWAVLTGGSLFLPPQKKKNSGHLMYRLWYCGPPSPGISDQNGDSIRLITIVYRFVNSRPFSSFRVIDFSGWMIVALCH